MLMVTELLLVLPISRLLMATAVRVCSPSFNARSNRTRKAPLSSVLVEVLGWPLFEMTIRVLAGPVPVISGLRMLVVVPGAGLRIWGGLGAVGSWSCRYSVSLMLPA